MGKAGCKGRTLIFRLKSLLMLPYQILFISMTHSFTTALEPHPQEALNTGWFRFKKHHREVNLLSLQSWTTFQNLLVPLYYFISFSLAIMTSLYTNNGKKSSVIFPGFPVKDTLNLDLLFNFIILLRQEPCTVSIKLYIVALQDLPLFSDSGCSQFPGPQ